MLHSQSGRSVPSVPSVVLFSALDALVSDVVLSPAHIVLHALAGGQSLATAFATARRITAFGTLAGDPAWASVVAWRTAILDPQRRLDADLVIVAVIANAPLRGKSFDPPKVLDLMARLTRDPGLELDLPAFTVTPSAAARAS